MTVEEKQEWLEVKYPLTIISDRYDGTYSGASWLAFPLYCDEVPPAVDEYDEACAAFWKDYSEPVGKGNSAQTALDDLIKQMYEFKPEESEDERIRNEILLYIGSKQDIDLDTHNRWCTWLEKWKERGPLTKEEERTLQDIILHLEDESCPTKWKDLLHDIYILPYEKQKEPHFTKRNVLFDKCVENCDPEILKKVSDEVDEMLQKEQKPAEWDEYTKMNLDRALQIIKKAKGTLQGYQSDDGIYECDKAIECLEHFLYRGLEIEKPAEWSEEDELMILTIIQTLETLGGRGTTGMQIEWLKSLPERFNLQPKQEWSEEDEKMLEEIINHIDTTSIQRIPARPGSEIGKSWIKFLKSLRPQPHWKPSEEQMEALRVTLEYMPDTFKPRCTLETLQNDLKKHM